MDDKRRGPRRRVLKTGKILFDGAAIDCVVRNLSEAGAALAVETPVGIPPRFFLLVETDGLKRSSRVVWRNQRRIGVKFDDGNGQSRSNDRTPFKPDVDRQGRVACRRAATSRGP